MGLSDFFSSGGSQTNSTSTANSGFLDQDKARASQLAVSRLNGISDAAEDYFRNQSIPKLQFSTTMPGLLKEQEGFANAFANQLFNKVSGSAAARGQMSPFNTPAIVGSALTKAAPTLLPMISQNVLTGMTLPDTIWSNRMNNAMSPLQALIAGLGSSSTSNYSGQSAGPGLGYVGGSAFMNSFGSSLGNMAGSGGMKLMGI